MTTGIYNQLVHEQDAWKRSLEFYKQENALLKYRLSEMVDKSEGHQFLQTAEYFQNEFLVKDEILKNLSMSLQAIIASFEKNGYTTGQLNRNYMEEHETFRQKIWQFQQDFNVLSKEFMLKIKKNIG